MADPGDDNLQALLTSRQALLRRYRDGRRSFLELRTGFKVQLCGEAPTGFLSALAKSRKAKAGIKELVWDGVSHTDARAILETATRHFREAFDESSGLADAESELQWTPRTVMEEAYAEALTKDWTEEEMPEVANEAVTMLLYQKGAETDVRNYRPITLLTSIHKILAKVVATRMKAVLHQVISGEQYGFLPGRRLTDAVSMVADLIDAAKNENKDWYLMMIDFEKSYDSIEALHIDVHTRLCINGWTGDQIQMLKGVRQGCPLAPYLFLCAVEPLSRLAEEKQLGIGKTGRKRLVYIGYADDTTLLLKGKQQLKEADMMLQEYVVVSGVKVNNEKSAVLLLGENVNKQVPAGFNYKWVSKEEAERLIGAGEDFQMVAAAVQANPMAVLLDSGGSHHLMGLKAVFVDMTPSDGVKHVRGFNKALQHVEGHRTVALQGEAGKRVPIPDVLFIPGVQANLLSAGQLKESGVQLQGDGDEMLLVAAAGEVLGRARYNGRVLFTDLRPCSTRSQSTEVVV
ncbi:unnamed protein product [Closterium sp. NIES-54]